MIAKRLIVTIALFGCIGISVESPPAAATAPDKSFSVVAEYPHDTSAYTEGLVYLDGRIYESTGLVGQSSLREVEIATGKSVRLRPLLPPYYGEGLARVGNRWLQLTWTTGVCFLYNDALQPIGHFEYRGEGWGLTYDGQAVWLSDGTPTLRRLDPRTFKEIGSLEVRDGNVPVAQLNELEFAQGHIFANIWMTDRIAEIDPASGAIRAWIDLSPLRNRFLTPSDWDARENVPNGIAYDPRSHHFFVTGKRWPKLFEITLHSGPVNN